VEQANTEEFRRKACSIEDTLAINPAHIAPATIPVSPLVRKRESACERWRVLERSEVSAVGVECITVDPMAMGKSAASKEVYEDTYGNAATETARILQPANTLDTLPYLSARKADGCEAAKETRDMNAKLLPISTDDSCNVGDNSNSGSNVICEPDKTNQKEPCSNTMFLRAGPFHSFFQAVQDTPKESFVPCMTRYSCCEVDSVFFFSEGSV